MLVRFVLVFLLASLFVKLSMAQSPGQVQVSVDAGPTIDAAGPEQRKSLKAMFLIVCPVGGGLTSGSGFLVERGVIVTNNHVVKDCTKDSAYAISIDNRVVRFDKIIVDPVRDIALLVPKEAQGQGLRLAGGPNREPGTVVTTWGYPFLYNGTSPLLSVGYIAGYRTVTDGASAVKHIIVNGAFNHGNSGGPLLVSHNNDVIGIVVTTFHFYPPQVKQIIDVMNQQTSGFQYHATSPDGTDRTFSEGRLTSMVLDEFYNKTQVVIGEAIAASELTALIKEKSTELPGARSSGPTN